MSFISELADLKGGATLENLQHLVNQELDNRKQNKFLKKVSNIISEILVGIPPELTEEEVKQGKKPGILISNDQVKKLEECIDEARICWKNKSCKSLQNFKFTDDQIKKLEEMM